MKHTLTISIFMKKISIVATRIVGSFSNTFNLNLVVKSNWENIVGKDLRNFTIFDSARYTSKAELLIRVKVLSSALLIVKYNSEKIVESLRNLLGISNIKLCFKQTSTIEPQKEIIKTVSHNSTPEKETQTELLDLKFSSNSLKASLESLKAAMKNAA